jgi:cytidyltransferase-like protein
VSVGYLPHSFDLFNVAHLDLIASALEHCDRLVLGVLADDEVLRRTGRPPVVPLVERLELVSHVRGVDSAVVHAAAPAPDGATLLVAASERASWPAEAVALPAGRTSSSPTLQRALRPLAPEAVA